MKAACPNVFHRRRGLAVRFCPDCGELINGDLPARRCQDQEHARRKKDREPFCALCGERLTDVIEEPLSRE